MTLVEELRSKKSRDNRELLNRAADRIEELENHLPTALKNDENFSAKDRITNILLNFAKEKQMPCSMVICELLAEELIRNDVIIPTHCSECPHCNSDGHCFVDVEGVGYKKTHKGGYCDSANNGSNHKRETQGMRLDT